MSTSRPKACLSLLKLTWQAPSSPPRGAHVASPGVLATPSEVHCGECEDPLLVFVPADDHSNLSRDEHQLPCACSKKSMRCDIVHR